MHRRAGQLLCLAGRSSWWQLTCLRVKPACWCWTADRSHRVRRPAQRTPSMWWSRRCRATGPRESRRAPAGAPSGWAGPWAELMTRWPV